jgi:hypothetical protein
MLVGNLSRGSLEQAPHELKRLVEFMNNQMGTIDVLLVEARQYEANSVRVVVPTLFGFTEKIRQIKLAASTQHNRQPVAIDWDSFKSNAEQKGTEEATITAMRKVYDTCKSLDADISWGRGISLGSFSPKWPNINPNVSLFSVYSNGRLELHLSSFQNSEATKEFSGSFAAKLLKGGMELPDGYRNLWLGVQREMWVPHADMFTGALQDVLPKPVFQSQSPE